MGAVIEVKGVGKTYLHPQRPLIALQDISFTVEEGQFVTIVGPSGCGKTTLLQIMAGLVPSSRGEVFIDNVKLQGPVPEKIAVVFQDAMLLPWRTSLANVALPLEIRRMDRDKRDAHARALLQLVGLAGFEERYPHELSGGMKQRVAIARGLVQNPRIVMMDEPFGALDEQTRTRMGDELLRIWNATHKTILLITHSLTEAVYLSDIVQVMGRHPGRIVDTVMVDLPRPRTIEMIGSEPFGRLRNRIWRSIGSENEERVGCSP